MLTKFLKNTNDKPRADQGWDTIQLWRTHTGLKVGQANTRSP